MFENANGLLVDNAVSTGGQKRHCCKMVVTCQVLLKTFHLKWSDLAGAANKLHNYSLQLEPSRINLSGKLVDTAITRHVGDVLHDYGMQGRMRRSLQIKGIRIRILGNKAFSFFRSGHQPVLSVVHSETALQRLWTKLPELQTTYWQCLINIRSTIHSKHCQSLLTCLKRSSSI